VSFRSKEFSASMLSEDISVSSPTNLGSVLSSPMNSSKNFRKALKKFRVNSRMKSKLSFSLNDDEDETVEIQKPPNYKKLVSALKLFICLYRMYANRIRSAMLKSQQMF